MRFQPSISDSCLWHSNCQMPTNPKKAAQRPITCTADAVGLPLITSERYFALF